MLKINEKQTKDQKFENSSTQLTEKEMELIHGGDGNGNTSTGEPDENG